MQYTLRNVSRALDEALRRRAREAGKSLNEITLEALSAGLGLETRKVRRRDLSDLAGSWKPDGEFKRALAMQDRVDPEIWK